MSVITHLDFYNKYKSKYIKIGGSTAGAVDWNGSNGYAGQCATLAREYLYQCYGYQNKSYGNGCDYINIPKGKRLNVPENWCLIVWPKQAGLPYGHVAVYYNGKMISQNPNKVALIPIWTGKKYYIRPYRYKKPTKPKIKKWNKKIKYKSKVDYLNVRLSASESGRHYRYLHKKTKAIKFWGEIKANGRLWYVYTNIYGKTCYVAAEFLKKG